MKNNLLGLGLLATIVYSSVSYSAVLNVQNGALFGATGVDVNGVLYDVSFLDGTCPELYNGCDQDSDFPFSNPGSRWIKNKSDTISPISQCSRYWLCPDHGAYLGL